MNQSTQNQLLSHAVEALRSGHPVRAEPLLRQILQSDPHQAQAGRLLSILLRRTARIPESLNLIERLCSTHPASPDLQFERAVTLVSMRRTEEASAALMQVLKLNPAHGPAHLMLGRWACDRMDVTTAIRELNAAVRSMPNHPEALIMLAQANLLGGRLADAEVAARKATELRPVWVEAMAVLAQILMTREGKDDEALALMELARSQRPDFAPGWTLPAGLYESRGETNRALELVDEAVRRCPMTAELAIILARLSQRTGRVSDAICRLEPLKTDTSLAVPQRSAVFNALGTLHESLGQFDEAFSNYQACNSLFPPVFQAQRYFEDTARIRTNFSKERIKSLPRNPDNSAIPLLIVGMPRSGTSLVEQILASHPSVHAAGELPTLTLSIAGSLHRRLGLPHPFPDLHVIESLTADLVAELGREYLAALFQAVPESRINAIRRITDKMPHNFLNLGLVQLIVPGARAIYCHRNPVDNCFSVYSTLLNHAHAYGRQFDTLAHAYADHIAIMRHWRSTLDLPILDLCYESLVASPEPVIRDILAFAGLEFHPDCLKHHQTRRVVRTASIDQATKPIYRTSAGRWRRFERHLAPLVEALTRELGPFDLDQPLPAL